MELDPRLWFAPRIVRKLQKWGPLKTENSIGLITNSNRNGEKTIKVGTTKN